MTDSFLIRAEGISKQYGNVNDSPWHRRGWFFILGCLSQLCKGEVTDVARNMVSAQRMSFRLVGRLLLALVSGTILSYVCMLILGGLASTVGDAAGWPQVVLSMGDVVIYRFQPGPNGSFVGEVGVGTQYMALLLGLGNAILAARRQLRRV